MKSVALPGSWRLFAPAIVVWALAAWAVSLGSTRVLLWGTLGAACLLVLLVLGTSTRTYAMPVLRVSACVLALTVVMLARIEHLQWVRDAPDLRMGGSARFDVRVNGFPSAIARGDSEGYWVRAEAMTSRGDVPVTLWGEGAVPKSWAPGQRLTVEGTTQRLSMADASAYSLNLTDARPAEISAYRELITHLRTSLQDVSAHTPGAGLVPGFAVGDTSLVSEHLEQAMLASSLTHLIAVSGANCALIVTAVMWIAGRCGVPRRMRFIIAGGVLAGFVLVVGPDASIQRAALMATVTLMSGFGGRTGHGYPALALAMLILLFADPWQARQAGFTLSVAATAGILVMTQPLQGWLHHRLRIPAWLSLTLAVTLAAQIACSPLLLLLQPGIPVGGILANVLAAPAAPLGTGLGLIAMLLLQVHEALGTTVTLLASMPARWVEWLAFTTEAAPLSRWHWPSGAGGAVLLAAAQAGIAVAVILGRLRHRDPWEGWKNGSRIHRYVQAVALMTGVGVLVSVAVVIPAANRVSTPTDWAVVMCDVGQGDAFLLRDPKDPEHVLMVDTGDDAERLEACLTRFGVPHVDLLILTHDDRDHVGALSTIANRTTAALVSPDIATEGSAREVTSILYTAGIPYAEGTAGLAGSLGEKNGVTWEVLAPRSGAYITSKNAGSIVLSVKVGGIRVLMLGDTGASEHAQLLSLTTAVEADIIKVAHHGSKDFDPRLLAATGAYVGLISSGAGNRHGHPASEVVDVLDALRVRIARTDEGGSVAVSLRDSELHVWSER